MLLAQTTAQTLNEIATALQQFSTVGAGGLIAGVLVFIYIMTRRADKREEKQAQVFGDLIGHEIKQVVDSVGYLTASVTKQTEAAEQHTSAIVGYAERQMTNSQQVAKTNQQYLITFAEVRGSVTELNKTLNTMIAPSITRLADDTRKQMEIVSKQTDQNNGTLNLVKAFAAELSRHEKSAVSRSQQIHDDFERMRKDRQEHLDDMTKTIEGINTKLDTLIDSQRRLMEAVTVLIKRATDEHPTITSEGSSAAT